MTREEELQKELAEIAAKKEQDIIDAGLARMTLVGKCFASHLLYRDISKGKSYRFSVVHYTDKKYEKNSLWKYVYTGYQIDIFRYNNTFRVDCCEVTTESQSFQYEISLNEFNTVVNTLIPAIERDVNTARNNFKAFDYVSNGRHSEEQASHSHLDKLFVPYIDLSDGKHHFQGSHITVYEILKWEHHPFLYNSRLYQLPNWLEIVQSIRDNIYKNALIWGGVIQDRDMPRVRILDDFIKKCTDK